MKRSYHKLPPIEPDIRKWPVFLLSNDRSFFIRQMRTQAFQGLTENGTKSIRALLERALYLERTRIRENPWRVDPPDERPFWTKVRKRLGGASEDTNRDTEYELLNEIVHRYAQEIVGTFQRNTFLFARRFLTLFFGRLLNTIADRSLFSRRYKLYDKLNVTGEYEMVRSLMAKGTVVVVPTHSSNLDSILIGYVLDAILGLPSFSYGAGLNLYNTGYVAYFMNRLGAYRVDRRKKNLIYLETLKCFSRLSIERGVNSLFFPGGTRSRSGQIEPKVKIGLLSTAIEAQRALSHQGKTEKVFIVPLNVSYHFVLEAGSLISQHLREQGKERYLASSRDDATSIRNNLKFIWKLFSNSSEITFSFSNPMDVLGNKVNAEGVSLDHLGSPIDISDYFKLGDVVTVNPQRESQYSRILADKVVKSYYQDYVLLSSHLVAFIAFETLIQNYKELDLFGIVKLPPEDYIFNGPKFLEAARDLVSILESKRERNEIKLSPIFKKDVEDVIEDGLKNIGVFHAERPLFRNKKGEIRSDSFKILYFYHNRLKGYQLEDALHWAKYI